MADAIVIKIQLTAGDLNAGKADIRKAVKSALDAAVPDAKEIGQKIGNALSAGVVEGLNKAKQLRTQLDQLLSPTQRLRTEEAQERAHQQRLAEIRERGAQQQAAISARAAAQAERDARRFAEAQERALRRAQPPDSALAFFKRYSSTIREAGESIQQAGYGLLGLTAGVLNVGKAAVQSAVDIDRQVNVLRALTGSAQAAESRFASLVKLAAQTPGLTTSLAATLDAQLRVANVSVGTIDKILPAIGRLNAVSPLGDPQKFGQNLVQLITQGFERADLKELVGQSPLGGEIIKSIFNVDSPINSKAIKESAKKLGITTTDAFFAAFAEAAAQNPKLANISESLGAQFDKLRDRVVVALRPLGTAIIEALKPLVENAIPIIEQLSAAFTALPQSAQQAILIFGALTAAIGPLVIALGGLIQTVGAVGNLVTVLGGLFASGGALAGAAAAVTGFAAAIPPVALALGALAVVIGGTVAAFALFGQSAEQATQQTRETIAASRQQVEASQAELNTLRNLAEQSKLNGTEQRKILDTYNALTPIQKERVNLYAEEAGGVDTLSGKLSGLIQLLEQENQKRREKLQLEAVDTGKKLINETNLTIANFQAQQNAVSNLSAEIGNLARKQAEAENSGARFNSITGASFSVADTFRQKIAELAPQLDQAKIAQNKSETQLRELALAFKEAAKASGQTTEQFIKQSIAASGLGGDLGALERRIKQFAGVGASQSAPSRAALLTRGLVNLPTEDKPKPTGFTGGGTGALTVEESLLKRLTKQAQEADLAIKQLQDTGSKEFALRIQIEDKQAFKSELEEIIKLRRELGLPLASPLPKTDAEAKSTIENLKAVIQNLKDFKELGEKTRGLDPLATFKNVQANNLLTQTERFNELQADLIAKSDGVKTATVEEALAKQLLTDKYNGLADAQKKLLLQQAREIDQTDKLRKAEEDRRKDLQRDFRSAEVELRAKELTIQNAINAGVITEAQGRTATLAIQRESAAAQIQILRNLSQLETDPEKLAQFSAQIEQLKGLGAELTPLQALFKGFRSQAETLAESFERIGSAFKDKVLGVVDAGIDKLTSKLGFFKSLVGDILKSLTRVLLGNLFQPRVGGTAAGGGLGGILGNLFNTGGAQGGGGLASIFTGGFAGGGGAGAILGGGGSGGGGGLLGALASAINPVSIPRSVSLGGLPIAPNIAIPGAAQLGGASKPGGLLGSLGLNFSGLFNGIGFGKAAGSGGALASALPLLGLSLGASVGTDKLTSIIGGAGGLALGVGLTAAPAALAGSSLGFLAPLFSNPITAIAGGIGLVGAFLLGRARQRRRDESTSGDYLQQAVDSIKDLRKQVESNEVTLTVSQAREIFNNQILQTFIGQINTIKTKSVRESRLKNQTADLRNLFEKEVIPAVQAQKTRQGINDKLIPEFAFGGIVPGLPTPGIDSVLARLSPGEMVLTVRHQQMIQAMAGGNVFAAAGVPNAGQTQSDGSQAFAFGGIATAPVRSVTPTINLTVQLNVSPSEATNILEAAASTDDGQTILVRARKVAALNGIGRTRV